MAGLRGLLDADMKDGVVETRHGVPLHKALPFPVLMADEGFM